MNGVGVVVIFAYGENQEMVQPIAYMTIRLQAPISHRCILQMVRADRTVHLHPRPQALIIIAHMAPTIHHVVHLDSPDLQ
jgi:hypothetical protein